MIVKIIIEHEYIVIFHQIIQMPPSLPILQQTRTNGCRRSPDFFGSYLNGLSSRLSE